MAKRPQDWVKLIGGLAIVLIMAAVVIDLSLRTRRMAVELSLVGYTNVNGTSMSLFKIQNNQSRRIWIRHCDYLLGKAFQEPPGAWQCSNQAASNRWNNSIMVPQQYLPPEPTPTSPDPTNLIVPLPKNQSLWRIGVTVEFNITVWRRIRNAWIARDVRRLNLRQFINNSPEAIWVECAVITNATALSDGGQ
jgi:hypothetical protein